MNKISIIIPALNEEGGIGGVIGAIPRDELNKMGFDVQILVVDGDSQDRTGELARKAGAEVIVEPGRGYGRAYKTGFASAAGEIIATADADLTYPVEDIPELVRVLKDEDLDFITTNRFACMEKGAMSLRNRIGNGILTSVTRLLFRLDIHDSQSGMGVFKKYILGSLVLKSDKMSFSEELKIEACYFARFRYREMPIKYRPRVGEIKLRALGDGSQNLLYLMKKRLIR